MKKYGFIASLILLVLLSTSLSGANATNDERSSIIIEKVQHTATAGEYWTDAAMAKAIPMDFIRLDGKNDTTSNRGNQTYSALNLTSGSTKSEKAAYQSDLLNMEGGIDALVAYYNYPPPFSRFNVPDDYQDNLHKRVGKLFFNQGGTAYVCSASVIQKRVIISAGHCLSNGKGKVSKNIKFVPAYKNGNRPYGTFTCNLVAIRNEFHNNGNLKYDVAFCRMGKLLGQHVGQVTGWFGLATGGPRLTHWNAFGYPA
ncbi:MAG: trypsin-like serine protease, partial [Chloroflexota bacterium]